ncbi:MAG TPA: polymer-forming cytoskeletal protein [Steroidobacteraceae bacterium]|nr:polymer-forming cytoskeletal protein [Steroidobacteraceae bacterium]
MFGRDSRQTARIDTLIARNTRIQGDVVFAGGLHLDGRVQGNVRAEPGTGGTLSVSEHGSVEGSVEVASVVLNGTVKGDIHAAERVVLGAHARVQGNVHYGVIEMEIGAEIRGKLVPAPPRAGVADAVAGDALAASGAVAA